jgi:methionyl-tRNA formyltransferase
MSSERARVLLIGFGPTSASALESLVERFDVVGVVRDGEDAVCQRARGLGIDVYAEGSLKAIDAVVSELQPACVVVSSFDRILPAALIAKSQFVNVHYAPLPQYRGRANVNWALINGEGEAGISIHTIVPGLDAGNILFQQTTPIHDRDTVGDLYDRLNAIQRHELGRAVQRFLDGEGGAPQDEREATYGCTRLPEDGEIDWAAPTLAIDRLVRALTPPYPGAFTYLDRRPLRIWRAEPVHDAPRYVGRVPGRVVSCSKRNGFADVLTGDGVLRLHEVQLPGGSRAPAAEVITSTRTTLGLRPSDLLKRIDELEARIAALTAADRNHVTPAAQPAAGHLLHSREK